jgi:hypothetical protein
MKITEVLVTTPTPDGTTAGVVRDEDSGMLLLVASIEGNRGGTGIDDYSGRVCGLRDHMLQGGLVPPGATQAIVILPTGEPTPAAVGGGAYVMIYAGHVRGPLPVRFEDADGAIVRVPQPASWPSEPLDGSAEPCAACGGTEWDRFTAVDGSRGGYEDAYGNETPGSVLVCRRCGHEEGEHGFFTAYPPDEPVDEEAIAARNTAIDREMNASLRATLRDITFGVYVVAGREPRVCGWGGESIAVEHGELRVTTEREEIVRRRAEERARDELTHVGGGGAWPDLPEAELSLWLNTRKRERTREAQLAELRLHNIAVDGHPVEFAVVTLGDGWVAAADLAGGVAVTISSDGEPLDGIELVSVDPLELSPAPA